MLELLAENPGWLARFPVTLAIEYYVDPDRKHAGRGDLVVCNEAHDHYLVVEVKRSRGNRGKLLAQMLRYRDWMKWKAPAARVDCAAVEAGTLLRYRRDRSEAGPAMFFTRRFQEAWTPDLCRKRTPPRTPLRTVRRRPPACARPPLRTPALRL